MRRQTRFARLRTRDKLDGWEFSSDIGSREGVLANTIRLARFAWPNSLELGSPVFSRWWHRFLTQCKAAPLRGN